MQVESIKLLLGNEIPVSGEGKYVKVKALVKAIQGQL